MLCPPGIQPCLPVQTLQAQQARLQQDLEQRLQTQMQEQLRQAQLQLQQAQQQTQMLQRQALQAQAKAVQEAEARKRAEEEVRRAAALSIAKQPPMGQPKRVSISNAPSLVTKACTFSSFTLLSVAGQDEHDSQDPVFVR